MPPAESAAAPAARAAGAGNPSVRGAGRRAHLPIDDALAPFADLLRQHLPTPEDIEQAAALRRERRRRPAKARAAGAATALAVAALAGVLWADPVLHRESLATAVGERQARPLPDGSTVRLNSGTRVEVALHLRSRRLTLGHGEAAFEVAHAPWHAWAPWLQRPFTVQAGAVAVEDIGTVFNIRRDGTAAAGDAAHAGADITVQQGSVRVHAGTGTAPVVLHAGQALHTRPGTALPAPEEADTARVAAWQAGRLRLDATPLADAVAEMQRHRRTPITLADGHAAALRISGEFDLDRIDQLIDLLPRLAPVRVDRHGDGSVVIGLRTAHQKP